MDHVWIQRRPHLAPLVQRLAAVLKLADELYEQGRADGKPVDSTASSKSVWRARPLKLTRACTKSRSVDSMSTRRSFACVA
jgi:hypothetical protein